MWGGEISNFLTPRSYSFVLVAAVAAADAAGVAVGAGVAADAAVVVVGERVGD